MCMNKDMTKSSPDRFDIAATSGGAAHYLQLPLGIELIAGGERQLRVVRSSEKIKDIKLLQVVV
jgi:hypothetical protein